MSKFDERVKDLAEKAILDHIGRGQWLDVSYANRLKIPHEMLAEIWDLVDVEGIKRQMARRIEAEVADRVVNHIAAELATDIKQILSIPERREAIRAVARENLDRIMKVDNPPKPE